MSTQFKQQYESTPLQGANATYVEALYEAFLSEPGSVSAAWRRYFSSLGSDIGDVAHGPIVKAIGERARRRGAPTGGKARLAAPPGGQASAKQAAVSRLIQVYSLRGHLIADLDPLGLWERPTPAVLKLDYLGLGAADFDREFYTGGLAGTGQSRMKLREILALLKRIYCGKLAAEFAHISRARERLWLRERFESCMADWKIDTDEQRAILNSLTRAQGIERYLHTKYVGQKRFSLEGGETLIPMLDDAIQQAGARGVQEIVIGMAHRGRINVLVNVLGKSPRELLTEFEDTYDPETLKGSGDVKYHMGFSADIRTPGGAVHVVLAFNPSHLEIVNPVVEGSVKARQDRRGDSAGDQVLPVLIHGDAALAGQGVVAETFQLSQTRAFYTGGTIHLVINNQVGFTTSDPKDMRSTVYCSDVAKMVEAPIFHVNGDDPEAAVAAIRLALRYRQAFHKDVVIDLVCYRRLGHNEADEPAATQPLMYAAIRDHESVRARYGRELVDSGVTSDEEQRELADAYRRCLDDGRNTNEAALGMIGNQHTVDWSQYHGSLFGARVDTSVPDAELQRLASLVNAVPEDFRLNPRVERIVEDRRRMAAGEIRLDWGFAESLAYASLLAENYHVRLIGQDSRRGTFFHRHAAFHDMDNGDVLIPLSHIVANPGAFTMADSLLSEEAVLGFEYGYSTTAPDCLVIWEAQFGDFANGAQVVIDQFISSGQAKWRRLTGLTLFLPHGYEGQGPEHSSARIERFLQLCAEQNMQVCVPSTPAQMFHLLRRQMIRSLRKPLIVMTPKSLLRHRLSVSTLAELTSGGFRPVIGETEPLPAEGVERIVFCCGKVYFDLAETRRKEQLDRVAIVRLEELYPFPRARYARTIATYPNATEIVWCQEEPQNQGAWYQIRHRLQEPLEDRHELFYAGRPSAAAPASGIHALHVRQQQDVVAAALGASGKDSDRSGARRPSK
ncbi:2-oxoglutarate dehydrogenase E1 component [Candidatus Rariloculus sp.]|uniref:2-oxoglutarate dehydrogenase E1 component n=1 Tax=Candidatus Rariloculus sp. TaxID=3101265 RepID=UPI003D151746